MAQTRSTTQNSAGTQRGEHRQLCGIAAIGLILGVGVVRPRLDRAAVGHREHRCCLECRHALSG